MQRKETIAKDSRRLTETEPQTFVKVSAEP